MHPLRFPRRRLLGLAASGAALAALPLRGRAQASWPTQPVRVVVPFGPGGLADISMRLVGQKLAERLGQQVIIDNRPGAGGVVAASNVLSSPRDGHTLILLTNGTAISKTLIKLNYDPETDFVPVSSMAFFDLLLLTNKDGRLPDLKSLIAEGRRRSLTLATINPGSTQNLTAELFKSAAGLTNASVVPYKTSPDVLGAVMRGEVDMAVESYTALKGPVDAGEVRAIAATGPTRSAWLPKVPTVAEEGLAGFEVTGWNSVYAPAGTPPAVIERLNQLMQEVVALPDIRKRLLELGAEPRTGTPAEMAAIFSRDAAKWKRAIQSAGIKTP